MSPLTKSQPVEWELVPLTEIASLIRGVTYRKEDAYSIVCDGYLPLLRATNITGTSLTFDALVYVPQSCVSNDQLLIDGDVVIASSSGSKEIVGKAGQFSGGAFQGAFGAFCTGIRPHKELYARYLGYYCQSPDYRRVISDISAGSNINNIKSSELSAHLVPLPPRAEQTRIVEKLEELLSDLDAGAAELKAAQKKLTQYRQSLLKAAVEGALTAEWRATQHAKRKGKAASTESGAALLARILTQRRSRWEARQLAKFQDQGKTPPKDWKTKYPQPVAPDTSGLPDLSKGWVWASLDQLAEFITSGSRGWADYYAEQGATFIRSQNINKDRLDLSDIAFVNPPHSSEGARTLVKMDDLLLTITGANVGKAARVDMEMQEAYVSQHVALIRLVNTVLGNYLHLFLTAGAGGRGQLNKEAYGAGKPGLNLQQVGAVAIPLPGEQEVIALMQTVAVQFNAVQAQEVAITHGLKQSAAQRKNILQAAFSGELVPQDPADEPASVLLARIRAARKANAKPGDKSKKKKGAA